MSSQSLHANGRQVFALRASVLGLVSSMRSDGRKGT